MVDEELLIHDLAARAGISIRTIRYYIEQGLLPQPNYQGKYSTYTISYLDRLELIRRLKESYLPLKEIREIMNSLTDEQVHAKLTETPPASVKFINQPAPAQPAGKPGEKALQYINRLMEDQHRYKTKGTPEKIRPIITLQENLQVQQNLNQPGLIAARGQETWQRISLAAGVELHLRTPIDPQIERQVRQLINFAKSTFTSID